MLIYTNMTFWENRKRVNALNEYADNVTKYYNLVEFDPFSRDYVGDQRSTPVRAELNKQNAFVQLSFYSAGISPYYIHVAAPVAGGRTSKVNLIDNLFNLHNFDIYPQNVLDHCNIALGVYEGDYRNSIIRTFNPFFWIGRLLETIAKIPFYFLGKLGVNITKAEESFLGKLIKLVIKFFTVIQIFMALIDLLNFLGFSVQNFNELRSLYVVKYIFK